MQWVYVVTSIASALSAVLAWAAKLWWSKEYATAKDEIIKSKEAQIELLNREIQSLQELTPMKIREYFVSVKVQLEEFNDNLQKQLECARQEIEKKQNEIDFLKENEDSHKEKIDELNFELNSITTSIKTLETQLKQPINSNSTQEVSIAANPIHSMENIIDGMKMLDLALNTKFIESLPKITPEMLGISDAIIQNELMMKNIVSVNERFIKELTKYQPKLFSK